MTKTIISARGLTRRYGSFTAVNAIDLDVCEGEIFGLLGTNGAGKTSTLEILEGLAPATDGQISVFGKHPIKDRKAIRPHQAVMLQEGGFPSDLTAYETLRMWAGTLSTPLPISETLEKVDLYHRKDVRVSSLSGGERRRLDLACAIIGQPKLLFLDEPTTGLDPESRRSAWQILREINSIGTTIVMTTHYLEEAESLCERLAIMHQGKIVAQGTLPQVISGHHSTIEFHSNSPAPEFGETKIDGNRRVIATHHLQKDLTDLLMWARNNDVEISRLNVREASLESVFLSIADTPHVSVDSPLEA